MEKIVYILGAGFSAPHGLPVMSDFLEKSKDMYFENITEYSYFDRIFQLIKEVSYLKNYINCNLHNIEEILSILEMGYFVGDNGKELEQYKKFLKDVIKYYTPKISMDINKGNKSYMINQCFGDKLLNNLYGFFIANLFQIKLCRLKEEDDYFEHYSEIGDTLKNIDYGIITLNYDLVIENTIDFLNDYYPLSGRIKLNAVNENYDSGVDFHKLRIAKLHGCMTNDIIAPTWNKSTSSSPYIQNAWKLAYQMLIEANEIRIIGYSLPITDSYIKYLLSIAFKNSKHLKKIDVITRDSDGETKERYDKLFNHPKYQFKSGNFEDLLDLAYNKEEWDVIQSTKGQFSRQHDVSELILKSSILEDAHKSYMNSK